MQVFTEFIKSDLTEDQLLPVLRQLLPVLVNILGTPDVCFGLHVQNVKLTSFTATLSSYSFTDNLSFPSMRRVPLHGKRTIP